MRFAKRARIASCVLLAVGLLASACSSGSTASNSAAGNDTGDRTASDVGVTGDTITIGTHMPMTGPVAPSGLTMVPAFQAYVSYTNENGGINGRKLVLKVEDNAYNPAKTLSVVRKLVEQDKVFLIFDGFGTPPVQAAFNYLTEQKVPDVNMYTGTPQFVEPPQKYHFELLPSYKQEAAVHADYIKQTYPGAKVALLYQHDDFGQAYADVIKSSLGASLIAEQTYEATDPDVMSQVTTLSKSGATVAMCVCIVPPAVQFIKDAHNLGWKPHLQFEYGILNAQTVPLVGKDLIENAVSDTYVPPAADTSDPQLSKMKEILARYAPDTQFNDNSLFGLISIDLMVQMLKSAGANPTRESFLDAITSNTYKGLWYGEVKMSASNHNALSCRKMTRMVDGVVTPFGEVICG
jgi:ABC-type branched-subunit amino acid transport system substrate-binding protein